MNIFIDIETIPDQSPGALDRFMDDSVKVTCPHKTKAAIGADLGMVESEYKFIGADDLKQKWIDSKGEDAKKEQAKEKWLKTSFDGGYGQICCICISVGVFDFKLTAKHEKQLLTDFWHEINRVTDNRAPFFIAHNAKFDLPFLFHRSVINQVKPNQFFKPFGRHNVDHFCTMEGWAGYNGRIGLDRLCGILGVTGKTEGMSGADVWPEYQKGNIDKIAEYCMDDVRATKSVYNLLTFDNK